MLYNSKVICGYQLPSSHLCSVLKRKYYPEFRDLMEDSKAVVLPQLSLGESSIGDNIV